MLKITFVMLCVCHWHGHAAAWVGFVLKVERQNEYDDYYYNVLVASRIEKKATQK